MRPARLAILRSMTTTPPDPAEERRRRLDERIRQVFIEGAEEDRRAEEVRKGTTVRIAGGLLALALIAVLLSAGVAFAAHGGHGLIGFLLMMACVLYVICAILWLLIQGMADGPFPVRDKVILLGILVRRGEDDWRFPLRE